MRTSLMPACGIGRIGTLIKLDIRTPPGEDHWGEYSTKSKILDQHLPFSFSYFQNLVTMSLFSRSAVIDVQNQWQNPADILSLLLLVGPDVVQKALAQLSGSLATPVAFSFGWVAYSYASLVSIFGSKFAPL